MIEIMEKIETNNAKTPKSSGLYRRVNNGETIIGIICETMVPVNNVATFFAKSDDLTLFKDDFNEEIIVFIIGNY